MTGTLHYGPHLEDWQKSWLRDGVIQELYKAGYEIWQYVLDDYYVHQSASHVQTNLRVLKGSSGIFSRLSLPIFGY